MTRDPLLVTRDSRQGSRLLTMENGNGPRVTVHGSQATGHGPRVTGHGPRHYTSFTKFAPNAIDGVSAPESVETSTRATAAMDDLTVKL